MNVFANDMDAIQRNMRRKEKEYQQISMMHDVVTKTRNHPDGNRREEVLRWVYNTFKFMNGCVRKREIVDYDYVGFGGEGIYFVIVNGERGIQIPLGNVVRGSPTVYIMGVKISWIEDNNERRLIRSEENLKILCSSPTTAEYVPKFYLGGTMTYNKRKYRISFMEHVQGKPLDKIITTYHNKPELYNKIKRGVDEISKMGISHGDLKEDNIIVTSEGNVKIIDFGKSVYIPNTDYKTVQNYTGTPNEERLRSNNTSLRELRGILLRQ